MAQVDERAEKQEGDVRPVDREQEDHPMALGDDVQHAEGAEGDADRDPRTRAGAAEREHAKVEEHLDDERPGDTVDRGRADEIVGE